MRDGKELTQCAASRNSSNYTTLLRDIEADNLTGDIFTITTTSPATTVPKLAPDWPSIPGSIRSSFPLGPGGSTYKRAGGGSSAAMP